MNIYLIHFIKQVYNCFKNATFFFFEKSLFTTRNENFTGSQIDRLCATPESFFFVLWCFFLNWTPKKNHNENKQNKSKYVQRANPNNLLLREPSPLGSHPPLQTFGPQQCPHYFFFPSTYSKN